MIRIHKDGPYYWADVVDLHRDKTIGVTFKHPKRHVVLDAALSMLKDYEARNPVPKERTERD